MLCYVMFYVVTLCPLVSCGDLCTVWFCIVLYMYMCLWERDLINHSYLTQATCMLTVLFKLMVDLHTGSMAPIELTCIYFHSNNTLVPCCFIESELA